MDGNFACRRIGFGAKAVITGDVSQIDLPKTQLSGLIDAERVLRRVEGIAICRMTSADVVRHPLVARIVDAYDAPGRSGADRPAPPAKSAKSIGSATSTSGAGRARAVPTEKDER